jgi:putative tryptophan/tyrosine transport system substrate-binding protein
MRELGYIERRNLTIEWRFAGGEVGRLAELAAEVVQRKVDVIVAGETPPSRPIRISAIPGHDSYFPEQADRMSTTLVFC